jgi:hypothetical protein
MNRIAIALCCLVGAVSGCTLMVPLKEPASDGAFRLSLSDRRPETDKLAETDPKRLGYYGSIVGDGQFQPDRLAVLQRILERDAGALLRGEEVVVTELRHWTFMRNVMNIQVIGAGIPGPSPAQFGLPESEKALGWGICDLELTVRGKRYAGRSVRIIDFEPLKTWAPLTFDDAIEQVVTKLHTDKSVGRDGAALQLIAELTLFLL